MMPTSKNSKESSNSTLSQIDQDNLRIEEETRSWVKRVVVGLNLCPFAAKPVADHQLYVHIVRGHEVDNILQLALAQAMVLAGTDDDDSSMPGTALIVCPDLAPDDFRGEYLDVHNMIVEGVLPDNHLEGKIQVVPFHPQFVFEHNDDSDNDNDKMEYWTNRSPYPMFHILKEDDVSHAVQIMKGDTDRVWLFARTNGRNVSTKQRHHSTKIVVRVLSSHGHRS